MTDKKPEPKMVEVTLDVDLTHAGQDYKKGDNIKVTEHWAKLMKAAKQAH